MFNALRAQAARLDSSLPVYSMKTLESQLDDTLSTERLIATLSAAFGALATLLAAIGLYGVMAFVVARRTREIGLRMALGAGRRQVIWMVMREVMALVACGLVLGIPVAWALSRYVSAQLFGVKPADAITGATALAVVLAAAAGAGFLPARRASAIDPMSALRYE
jgi:ABC-type antimicrobial peptide transport system permease subunit